MKDLYRFFEAYKDDFFESMEDIRMYLKNNDLEYQNINQKWLRKIIFYDIIFCNMGYSKNLNNLK